MTKPNEWTQDKANRLAWLESELHRALVREGKLQQQCNGLLTDKERLDWMDKNDPLDVIDFFINEAQPIRAAIDKAMHHAAIAAAEGTNQ